MNCITVFGKNEQDEKSILKKKLISHFKRDGKKSLEESKELADYVYNNIISTSSSIETSFNSYMLGKKDFETYATGEPTIEEFFKWREHVSFQNKMKKVFSTNDFMSTQREFIDLADGFTAYLFETLYDKGFTPNDLFEEGAINTRENNILNITLNKVLDELREEITYLDDDVSIARISDMIDAIETNKVDFINTYNNYLDSTFGFKINAKSIQEQEDMDTDESKETKDLAYNRVAHEFDQKDGASKAIKMLIAGLYIPAENDSVHVNSLGLMDTTNYAETFNFVHQILMDVPPSIENYINVLKDNVHRKPELQVLINRLNFSEDGNYVMSSDPDIAAREQLLRTQFVNQFDKSNMEFTIHIKREDGTISAINANMDKVEDVLLSDWANNFQQNIQNNPNIIDDIFEAAGSDKLKFFQLLGLNITDASIIPDSVHSNIYNFGIKNKSEQEIFDIYKPNKSEGVKSQLKYIANKVALQSPDVIDFQHYSSEGKLIYGITLNTHLSSMVKDLAYYAGQENKIAELYPQLFDSPYTFDGIWLRKIVEGNKIKMGVYDGFKNLADGRASSTKELKAKDLNVQRIVGMLMEGKYPFLRSADRGTENYFVFENITRPIIGGTTDAKIELLRHLESEIMTMQSTVDVAHFEKNNSDFRVFHVERNGKKVSLLEEFNPEIRKVITKIENENKKSNPSKIILRELENTLLEERKNALDSISSIDIRNSGKVIGFIDELMDSVIKKEESFLTASGVLDTDINGNYKHLSEVVREYKGINAVIEVFALNSFIANIEQTKLFVGDPAFYKNASDIFKRMSMFNSTKESARIDQEMLTYLSTLTNEFEAKHGYKRPVVDNFIKTMTIQDIESIASEFSEEFHNMLVELFGENSDMYMDAYNKINEADGFAFMSLDEYRIALNRYGQWFPAMEATYQKILNDPTNVSSRDIMNFTPLKLQYTGRLTNIKGMDVPAGRKFAVIPLVPTMIGNNTALAKLNEQMLSNGVGMAFFESAAKFGHGELYEMYDENGNFNIELNQDSYFDVLDYRYMGNQLKINNEAKEEITASTQKRKNMLVNIFNNGKIDINRLSERQVKILMEEYNDTDVESVIKKETERMEALVNEYDNLQSLIVEEGYKKATDGIDSINKKNITPSNIKPKVDTTASWSNLKNQPVYTEQGVNTMRTSNKDVEYAHFGNPFSEAGYAGTIKVPTVKDAIQVYKDWLLGKVYFDSQGNLVQEISLSEYKKYSRMPESISGIKVKVLAENKEFKVENADPKKSKISEFRLIPIKEIKVNTLFENASKTEFKSEQRQWILEQINSGKLDNATLLYDSKLAGRRQGSHAHALAEVVKELRGDVSPDNNQSSLKEKSALNRFVDGLLEQGLRQGYTVAELSSLHELKENPILEILGNKQKIENLIMAKLSRNAISNKRGGDSLAQIPDVGFEITDRVEEESSRHNLKFYERSKDGKKLLPMEIMVALPKEMESYVAYNYGNKDGNLTSDKLDAFNDAIAEDDKRFREKGEHSELSRMITYVGFRIPNQGASSSDVAKVKKFFPPYMHGSVAVPKPIVAKTGSDFDIDKMNFYKPHFRQVRENERGHAETFTKHFLSRAENPFGFIKNIMAAGFNANPDYYKTESVAKGAFISRVLLSNEPSDLPIIQQIRDEFQNYLNSNKSRVTALEYIQGGTENKMQIDNRLIEIEEQLTLHMANERQLLTPLTDTRIKEIVRLIRELRGEPLVQEDHISDIFTNKTNVEKFISFLSGLGGVGQTAVHIPNHAMAQKAGLKMLALHNYFGMGSHITAQSIESDVTELFESNPELANEVYEALGFGQESNNLDKKTPVEGLNERLENYGYTKLILPKDFREGQRPKGRLNFFKSSIIQVADNLQILEDLDLSEFSFLSTTDLEKLNSLRESVKEFRRLNSEISSRDSRTVSKEIKYAELSNKILNDFVDIINPHVKTQLGKSISTNKSRLKESQITPQQKQEAQQLYTQYLEQNPNGNIEGFKDFVQGGQVTPKQGIADTNVWIDMGNIDSIDGVNISEILSEIITSFVDVAKDDYILDINAVQSTTNTIMMMIRQGMPLETIFLFMNQPIIREYVRQQQLNESIVSGEDALDKAQLVSKVLGEFGENTNVSDMIYYTEEQIADGRDVERKPKIYNDIDINNLKDNIRKGKRATNQKQMLDLFLEYQRQSRIFSAMVRSTSPDTKGFKNLNTLMSQLQERIDVEESGMFLNYDKMFEGFVGTYHDAKESYQNLVKDMFLLQQEAIVGEINKLKDLVITKFMDQDTKDRILTLIDNEAVSHMLAVTGQINYKEDFRRLFTGPRSIPKVVREIQEFLKEQGVTNAFFDNMLPLINETREGYDSMKPKTKKLTTTEKEIMAVELSDFIDYYESHGLAERFGIEDFRNDILKYQMIQSGIKNSPYSFMEMMNPNDYHNMSKVAVNLTKDDIVKWLDFTNTDPKFQPSTFIMHHLNEFYKRSKRKGGFPWNIGYDYDNKLFYVQMQPDGGGIINLQQLGRGVRFMMYGTIPLHFHGRVGQSLDTELGNNNC